jgi:hypothetical protein
VTGFTDHGGNPALRTFRIIARGCRRLLVLLLAAWAAVALPFAAEARMEQLDGEPGMTAQSTGFVGVQGRRFVAPDGATLHLKGINLGNWMVPEGYMFKFDRASSPKLIYTAIEQLVGDQRARSFWRDFRDSYITRADIRFIKRLGFNSVRVPLHYRLFLSARDSNTLDGPGVALLDRLIGWCREEGLYVILDMHAAPGGQTGDNIDDSWGHPFLYDSEHNQALLIHIWRTLAERYADEPAVLGYDLLNEPIAHFLDTDYFNPKLEPLFKRIATAIREVDPNHIIILSGAQWGTNLEVLGAPFDGKLAYTFHTYGSEPVQDSIQRYIDFAETHDVPLWLGESGENTDEWVAAMRQLLEDNGIGWAFWPYKKIDSPSAVVSAPKTEAWDAVIAFANSPRTSLDEIRAHRPPRHVIDTALDDLLANVRFENSTPNVGYIRALGLEIPDPEPDIADNR